MLVELDLVEQRYQAVLEVLNDGATVTDVARRYGVRQTVHVWLRSYAAEGLQGERSGDLAVGHTASPRGPLNVRSPAAPKAIGIALACAQRVTRSESAICSPGRWTPWYRTRQDQRPRTTPGGESRTPLGMLSETFRRAECRVGVGQRPTWRRCSTQPAGSMPRTTCCAGSIARARRAAGGDT
jgi:transposase-like protein